MSKELLAQALQEYPTWGDAYIAERERRIAAEDDKKELAEALIDIARLAMPDSYFQTDSRVNMARRALNLTE